MAVKEQLADILNKKMNRQEFLKEVAVGLVAISGASAALKLLAPKHTTSSAGYGMSAYGGSRESLKSNG